MFSNTHTVTIRISYQQQVIKVMPICPKCGKAVRVGHVEKDGKMVRVCNKCGAAL